MQETSADDSSYAALGDRVTGILEIAAGVQTQAGR
jgi:hypothetical protein